MSTRLLMMLGAALGARGHQVAAALDPGSDTDKQVRARFTQLPRRDIDAQTAFGRRSVMRRLIRESRVDALLVGTMADARLAASASTGAPVVYRRAFGESRSANARPSSTDSRLTVLGATDGAAEAPAAERTAERTASRTAERSVPVAWPSPLHVIAPVVNALGTTAVPVLAIVPGLPGDARTHVASAAALRAASRLVGRYPDLRVLLLGDIERLQAMRLHAASVGLTDRMSILPLDALIAPGAAAARSDAPTGVPSLAVSLATSLHDAGAVWVAEHGDRGAVAALSAMMRRIPVIVPRGIDIEALIAPRITGFASDDGDPVGSVSALAQLFADPATQRAMGTAAASRAERLHDWESLVTRTEQALLGPRAG